MENRRITKSIESVSVSEQILQEKAKIIASHIISKSLRVYKDDPYTNSKCYNQSDIDSEIKKYQDIEIHLAAQLNVQCLSNCVKVTPKEQAPVVNKEQVPRLINEDKLLSLERRSGRGVNVRKGTSSLEDDHLISNSSDLKYIDSGGKNKVCKEDNETEFLTDSESKQQRPFTSEISNAQSYRKSEAFELDRGQHFKSVLHPRKRLFKTYSSSKLLIPSTYDKSINDSLRFAKEGFKTVGEAASGNSLNADVDLATDEGNKDCDRDIDNYFINTSIEHLDLQTTHRVRRQNTTKSKSCGQQNLHKTTLSFAKLVQDIGCESEKSCSKYKNTTTSNLCASSKDFTMKLENFHRETNNKANSSFLDFSDDPRQRVQTAPTSSLRQMERTPRYASFSRKHSELYYQTETLESLQSVYKIGGVETDLSKHKRLSKYPTGESSKIDKNPPAKITRGLSFEESVLKIWGIDKALKCWKKKIERSGSTAREHKTSTGRIKHHCLGAGQSCRNVQNTCRGITTSKPNSSDQTSSPIVQISGKRSSKLKVEIKQSKKLGENSPSCDSFSTNVLALVEKWKEISIDGGTSADNTFENCLSPPCSRAVTSSNDIERSRRVWNTKSLILNSYLEEVQAHLNSLINFGQTVKTSDISNVSQIKNNNRPEALSVEKPPICVIQRAVDSSSPRTPKKILKTSHSDSQILSKSSTEGIASICSDGSSLCLDVQTQFRCIHNTQSEYFHNSQSSLNCCSSSKTQEFRDSSNENVDLDKQRSHSTEDQKTRKPSDLPTFEAAHRLSRCLSGESPTSDDVFFTPKSMIDLQTDSAQGYETKARQYANVQDKVSTNFTDTANLCESQLFGKGFDEDIGNAASAYHIEYEATAQVTGSENPTSMTLASSNTSFTAIEIMGYDEDSQSNNDNSNQLHTGMRASPEGQSHESIDSLNSGTESLEISKSQKKKSDACPVISTPFLESNHNNKIQHATRLSEASIDRANTKSSSSNERKYSGQSSFRQIPYMRHKRINLSRLKDRLTGLHKMPSTLRTAGNVSRSKANPTEISGPDTSLWKHRIKSPPRLLVGSIIQGASKLLPLNSGRQFENSLASLLVPGVLSCAQAIIGGTSSTELPVSSSTHRHVVRPNSPISVSKWKRGIESSPEISHPRPPHRRIDELRKGEDHNKLCRKHSWLKVKPATRARKGPYFRGYSVPEKSRHTQPMQSKAVRSSSSPLLQHVEPERCEGNSQREPVRTMLDEECLQTQAVSNAKYPHKQPVQPKAHEEPFDVAFQEMPHEISLGVQIEELQIQEPKQPRTVSDKECKQLSLPERISQSQSAHKSSECQAEAVAETILLIEVSKERSQTQQLTLTYDGTQSVPQPKAEALSEDSRRNVRKAQFIMSQNQNTCEEQRPKTGPNLQSKLPEMEAESEIQDSKELHRLKSSHRQPAEFVPHSSPTMSKLLRGQLQNPGFLIAATQGCRPHLDHSVSQCPPLLIQSTSTSRDALIHKSEPSEQTKQMPKEGRRRSEDRTSSASSDFCIGCCLPCLK